MSRYEVVKSKSDTHILLEDGSALRPATLVEIAMAEAVNESAGHYTEAEYCVLHEDLVNAQEAEMKVIGKLDAKYQEFYTLHKKYEALRGAALDTLEYLEEMDSLEGVKYNRNKCIFNLKAALLEGDEK